MGQSNIYSHLTDYQRTSGPVKATLLVLSLWDNQTCTVTSLITREPVVLVKQDCWFYHCGTIKHVQSPHWLPEDQCSCKSNIVGFVTVRQSNMYSHLTDYQITSGPVKATLLVLSLWDNQTCTVTSLITRRPAVLQKQNWWFCHCGTIKHGTIMYSHLTDYQRTSCPVKTTLLCLSLWYNQTCNVTSLITRGPVVLL